MTRKRTTAARDKRKHDAEREAEKEREIELEQARQLDQAQIDVEDIGFDFEEVSLKQSREIAMVQADIYAAYNVEDPDERKDALDDAFLKMSQWLALVVTSIPLDWFIRDFRDTYTSNGAKPDFSDAETYDSLKDIRFNRLMNAMNLAREEQSKN